MKWEAVRTERKGERRREEESNQERGKKGGRALRKIPVLDHVDRECDAEQRTDDEHARHSAAVERGLAHALHNNRKIFREVER